jgi:hypothetical protein
MANEGSVSGGRWTSPGAKSMNRNLVWRRAGSTGTCRRRGEEAEEKEREKKEVKG